MTSFTGQQPGTPAAQWTESVEAASELPAPGRGDVLVVVAAHPDDETLGAGGLIATAARNGASVRVVIASDGAASHPDSPTHRPEQLAAMRRDEARTAAARLAPHLQPVLLDLPDGTLDARADQLATLLEPHLHGATHVATTWRRDGHPDHEALAAVVERLVADRPGIRLWEFPIWAWHWASPTGADLPRSQLARVPLTPDAVEAKRAALAAHTSQRAPLSEQPGDEAILPPRFLEHFARESEPVVIVRASAADSTYFDNLYAESADPWQLAGRFYERRKREVLLSSLPRERFRRAFEPGCATGELTQRLAERCEQVVSWDVAGTAVALTRGRCPSVRVEQRAIPTDWPEGTFDLIVLSEVGYYCSDLALLVEQIGTTLTPDGCVVACHWRHPAADHPHPAERVHAALADGLAGVRRVVSHTEDDFLLDVWTADGRSVAVADGLLG